MEVRTKIAAAAASVIPFSCVICFDEFNAVERPPMVLPCGHTYVCLPCTRRLKRCMECREPLFWPSNTKQPPSQSTVARTTGGRYSPNQQPPHTPTKSTASPIALPIPKNVVLLALMEAAERQAKSLVVQSTIHEEVEEDADQHDSANANESEEEGEEGEVYNLDHIITGMATMSGPCGTYAVRDPDGLALLAHDPRQGPPEKVLMPQIPSISSTSNSIVGNVDEDDDDGEEKKQDDVAAEHNHGEKNAVESIESRESSDHVLMQAISAESSDDEDPKMVTFVLDHAAKASSTERIAHGQRVQVVSFEDGVARLARGRGFVRANHRQLVKVGGPQDEACRLEGLLDTVRGRGSALLKTLQDNQKIEEQIKAQLQKAQEDSPDFPVISSPPMPKPSQTGPSPTPDTPSTPVSTPEKADNSGLREQFYTPQTDYGRYIQGTSNTVGAPHSPASIDNSDIMMFPVSGPAMPRYGASPSFEERENRLPIDMSFGCGVGFSLEGEYEDNMPRPTPNTPSHSLRTSHFRARVASSSPESTTLTPSLASSFDGVDFRTGLSGHRGLSHARKLHHSPKPRLQIRMMGEHRGIAYGRPSRTRTVAGGSMAASAGRAHTTVPTLGPRFSSPSSTS